MDWMRVVTVAAEDGGLDLRHPLVVALAVVAFTAIATFFSTWFTRREARREAQEDYALRTEREDQLRADDRRHEDARRSHDQRIESYASVIEASYGLLRTSRRMLPYLRRSEEPPDGLVETHATQYEAFSYRWAVAKLLASREVRRALDLMESGATKLTSAIATIPFDIDKLELGISVMGQGMKELRPVVQREMGLDPDEEPPGLSATSP